MVISDYYDCFITSIKILNNNLWAKDEKNREYLIDINNGKVIRTILPFNLLFEKYKLIIVIISISIVSLLIIIYIKKKKNLRLTKHDT